MAAGSIVPSCAGELMTMDRGQTANQFRGRLDMRLLAVNSPPMPCIGCRHTFPDPGAAWQPVCLQQPACRPRSRLLPRPPHAGRQHHPCGGCPAGRAGAGSRVDNTSARLCGGVRRPASHAWPLKAWQQRACDQQDRRSVRRRVRGQRHGLGGRRWRRLQHHEACFEGHAVGTR